MKWTCGIVHLVSSFVNMGSEKFQSDKKNPYLRSTDKGDMPHTFFLLLDYIVISICKRYHTYKNVMNKY